DGRYNEDGVGGLDLHRNYPYNWRPEPGKDLTGRGYTQNGAGEFPLSEPETKAVFMWLITHPNVGVVNTMDTAVPMHLRGPSTCEEAECMFPKDRMLYQYFDSVGLSFTKYPWAGDVYRTYATRTPVNPFTGDSARPSPLFGHSPDYGYFQYGAIWYGDELWNGGRERDYDNNGVFEQWEVSRWCHENYSGDCFQPWTRFQHPQLGEVEMGGFNPKFYSQSWPPEMLEQWARRQAECNLFMAKSLPRIEITNATMTSVSAGARDSATHEIRVTVRNTGRIPTALEIAQRVKAVRPDMISARFANGSGSRTAGRAEEFHLDGGESRTITVRVRHGANDRSNNFTVRAISTCGGIAARTVSRQVHEAPAGIVPARSPRRCENSWHCYPFGLAMPAVFMWELLLLQHHYRIYPCCAPGRYRARHERHRSNDGRHRQEGERICRRHPEQQRTHQPRQPERCEQPDADSSCRGPHSLAEHHSPHDSAIGTQGHSHTYLAPALGYHVRQNAVRTHGGEQQRHEREYAQQLRQETRTRNGIGYHRLHGSEVHQREARVQCGNGSS